jgi:16S rRNA processing protein RimM
VAGGFGVKGEMRISTFTAEPLALARYKTLLREDGSAGLTVLTARPVKDAVIARIAGIDTKDAADALRGLRLYIPRDALPEPDEDEFYLTDLIGLSVEDTAGKPLGRIKAVPNFGSGDLLEIEPPRGGATFYLPFTRQAVPEVRLADRKVIADPPGEIEADPNEGTDAAAEPSDDDLADYGPDEQ